MSPPGQYSHRGSPAGAGNAELTAAAGNAGGTPSPGSWKENTAFFTSILSVNDRQIMSKFNIVFSASSKSGKDKVEFVVEYGKLFCKILKR